MVFIKHFENTHWQVLQLEILSLIPKRESMQPKGAAFRNGIKNNSLLLTWISAANLISSEFIVPNCIFEIFLGAEDFRIVGFRSDILICARDLNLKRVRQLPCNQVSIDHDCTD